jgi:hypothetical protein
MKALALDALDVKVRAGGLDDVTIEGVIPLEIDSTSANSYLLTTGQTWASLFHCRYSYIEGKGYVLSKE